MRESRAAGRDSPVGSHAERRRGLVPSLDDGEEAAELAVGAFGAFGDVAGDGDGGTAHLGFQVPLRAHVGGGGGDEAEEFARLLPDPEIGEFGHGVTSFQHPDAGARAAVKVAQRRPQGGKP